MTNGINDRAAAAATWRARRSGSENPERDHTGVGRSRVVAREPVAAPRVEGAGANRGARVAHQANEEMYIVQGEQAKPEDLVGDEEVADVGAGESAAGGAVAVSSSGRGSVRNSARLMLSRPSRVNAAPLRPMRVGATQSNRSTPRRTPSTRSSGKPTPMR